MNLNGKWKWIPNALTCSRPILAFGIAVCASQGRWRTAFALLVIGLLTDWLDGFLVIKLDAVSNLGKLLDPFCDFALTVGALWGLVFTETVPWAMIGVLAVVWAAIWTPIIFKKNGSRIRIFCRGISPFYSLSVIIVATIIYAFKAFGGGALWLLIAAVPAAAITVRIKRHRLATWLTKIKGG
jgi:phosphatidylglycerophosphate synthase